MVRPTGDFAGTEDVAATGDFDGDGLPDEAYFVRKGNALALVLSRSAAKAPVLLKLYGDIRELSRVGVRTLPPGKYTAYCADRFARRGRSDCPEGVLRELVTEHDAIWLITFEAASTVNYWNEGRFQVLYYAD